MDILNLTIGNDYVLIFIFSLLFIWFTKETIAERIKKIPNYENTAKSILSLKWYFYILMAVFFSLQFMDISSFIRKISYLLFLGFLFYYLIKLIPVLSAIYLEKSKKKEEVKAMVSFVASLTKWILVILLILFVLRALGVNTNAILTGFGVSGIIIAFAIQNVLIDIFAYFSIYFDKPFTPGDFIIVGSESGTVKKIGIRSTRILSLKGEELIVSNRKLLDNFIHNYKTMAKRRKTFELRISEETKVSKIKELVSMIKRAIKDERDAEYDRVHFNKISNNSCLIEAVYFIASSEYNTYMDVQERINYKIKEFLEKNNIKLA